MAPPSGRTCGSPAARSEKMSRGWKARFGPSGAWAWANDDDAQAIASAETSKARRMEAPGNLDGPTKATLAGFVQIVRDRYIPSMAEAFNDKVLPAAKAER